MKRPTIATAGRALVLLVPAACSAGNIGGSTSDLSPDGSTLTTVPSPDGSTMTTIGPDGGVITTPIVDANVPLEATAPSTACASDGGKSTTYNAIGSGTAADPYVLCSAAQVVDLSNTPAGWKYAFGLGADVDLGGSQFKMIGTTQQPFTGTFDGGGHIISNVQVSNSNGQDIGFFGSIEGAAAEVRSLNMTGASITGMLSVGILAGSLNRGARVVGCSTQGTVNGDTQTGGLVGYGLNAPLISSSWSSATVTGKRFFIGGLVGLLSQGAFIFNSYTTGAVNGTDHIGGLLGGADSGGVYYSYSSAKVTSTDATGGAVGGLVGSVGGTIYQDCFATGDVIANGSNSTVGRVFGDPEYGKFNDNYDLSTSTCQVRSGTSCSTNSQTTMSTDVTLAQLQDKTMLPLSTWDFTNTWSASGGAMPTLHSVLFDARSWDGCAKHMTDSPFAGGDGTPDRPYLVCSASQFANLASMTKLRTGVDVLQMASIDFSSAGTLQPIGTVDSPFIGVYSGNGKTLSNFTVSGTNADIGLFGTVTGAINRVAAVNGTVTAGSSAANAGIIAGGLYGIIHDCYVSGGSVTGPTNVGGVGDAHTMVGCWSTATVTSTGGMAAGLTGAGGNDGSVWDSFASANVHAPSGKAYTVSVPVNSASQISNCFYDSSMCSGCTNIDAMAEATSYFYSATNAPLKSWDFDNVWMAQANGFPTLR